MKVLGIIPSRYASSRLPGKPLLDINGKSLVMRVHDQAKKVASLNRLVVATDDDRIKNHVLENGGEAVMTSEAHPSGTDRCAEVCNSLIEKFDIVINIQGDEPFIAPDQIKLLIDLMKSGAEIGTLYKRIERLETLLDPNVPKVALGENQRAIYFSRSPIPHLRGLPQSDWMTHRKHFKHIGIYGYQEDVLATISGLPSSDIEEAEQLEQLRWMANGLNIQAVETTQETISVDTHEDLEKARQLAGSI